MFSGTVEGCLSQVSYTHLHTSLYEFSFSVSDRDFPSRVTNFEGLQEIMRLLGTWVWVTEFWNAEGYVDFEFGPLIPTLPHQKYAGDGRAKIIGPGSEQYQH